MESYESPIFESFPRSSELIQWGILRLRFALQLGVTNDLTLVLRLSFAGC